MPNDTLYAGFFRPFVELTMRPLELFIISFDSVALDVINELYFGFFPVKVVTVPNQYVERILDLQFNEEGRRTVGYLIPMHLSSEEFEKWIKSVGQDTRLKVETGIEGYARSIPSYHLIAMFHEAPWRTALLPYLIRRPVTE